MSNTPETPEDKNAALRDALGLDRRVPNDAVYSADEDLQRRLRPFSSLRLLMSVGNRDISISDERPCDDVLTSSSPHD